MNRRTPTLSAILCLLLAAPLVACPAEVELSSAPGHDEATQAELRKGGPVTHGVIAGELGPHHAVVWARSNGPTAMHVDVTGPGGPFYAVTPVESVHDYTGRMHIAGLEPDAEYVYRVWFGNDGAPRSGRFVTPPLPNAPDPVRIVLAGPASATCHGAAAHEEVSKAMLLAAPKLSVSVGSGSNAAECRSEKSQVTLEDLRVSWRTIRDRPAAMELLASGAHESVQGRVDTTTPTDANQSDARQAFLEYNARLSAKETKDRGRILRWGQHVEFLFLDNATGTSDAMGDGPTDPRAQWILEHLVVSDATWKVVVSRDALATESLVRESGASQVLFISAGSESAPPTPVLGEDAELVHQMKLGPWASGFILLDVDAAGRLHLSERSPRGEGWSATLP